DSCRVEYHANPGEQEPLETDEWEVNPKNVELFEELGQGAFGKVYRAILRDPPQRQETIILAKLTGTPQMTRKNRHEQVVAVKTLHELADLSEKGEFVKEINLMKKLGSHQNIVNFLYCCTTSEPNFLVVEYLPKGDLLKYLRTNRHKVSCGLLKMRTEKSLECAPIFLEFPWGTRG
ncbi:hypothetical protein QZH41_020248, partial [Actinostola sp. cb2023]